MVLNLLQRFNLEEAKELILKSFGYYTSTTRLTPLIKQQEELNNVINGIKEFKCPFGRTTADMFEYNKLKNIYVEQRKTAKVLRKQMNKKNAENVDYVRDFEIKTKELLHKHANYIENTLKRQSS